MPARSWRCGAAQVPKLGTDFSLETWIALGAYPWNWAPIAAQENTVSLNSNLDAVTWPEDITVNSPRDGFFLGISPQGHLGQVGIRNVLLHTKGGPLHPDEVIVLCQPKQRPEDVIDLAAMTLVNLGGSLRSPLQRAPGSPAALPPFSGGA